MRQSIYFAACLLVLVQADLRADVIRVPEDFATIQQGIDAANAEDTVLVAPGIYLETVTLKPAVNLIGSGAPSTIIDGQGVGNHNGSIVIGAQNSLISGFLIRNANLNPMNNLGAGIDAGYAEMTIRENWVTNCRIGIAAFGSLHIEKNLIYANRGLAGIAVRENAIVRNNTVVYNSRGIQINGGSPEVSNNIVAFNSSGIWGSNVSGMSYNDVAENLNNYDGVPDQTGLRGNISSPPRFVDANHADFHLQPNSPCIDAGDPNAPLDPDGTIADMGAFYFEQEPPARCLRSNGPHDGLIAAITNSSAGNLLIASQGTVFESFDDGACWRPVGDWQGATGITVTTITTNRDGDIFAGAGNGVYRLLNGETAWEQVNTGPPTSVEALLANPFGTLITGTTSGCYRSTDKGTTWTVQNEGLTNTHVRALALGRDETVFAATQGGVFRSFDDGLTWSATSLNASASEIYAHGSGAVVASQSAGLFHSTDNGDSWQATAYSGGSINALAVDVQGEYLVASGARVFRSADRGESWTEVSGNLTAASVLALAFDADGGSLAGTTQGLFRSYQDGGDWIPIGIAQMILSLAVDKDDNVFAGSIRGHVYTSADRAKSWEARPIIGFAANPMFALAVDNSNVIFAGTVGTGMFRSTDLGKTWQPVNRGLTDPIIISIVVDSSDGVLAGTSSGAIFRTTDHGINWSRRGFVGRSLTSLIVAPNGEAFAGVNRGGVLRSSDAGARWEQTGLVEGTVQELAVHANGNVLAGRADGRIFESSDNGASWWEITNGLQVESIGAVTVDSHGNIYVGTRYGVHRSRDDGASWESLAAQLGESPILAFAVNSNGEVFAATADNGVFRLDVVTSVSEEHSSPPREYALDQNYPNPFNPTTTIAYELAQQSQVTISVFDLSGRLVETLVEQPQAAGNHLVHWHAGGVPTGVYFIRMRAGEFVQTRKAVLVR